MSRRLNGEKYLRIFLIMVILMAIFLVIVYFKGGITTYVDGIKNGSQHEHTLSGANMSTNSDFTFNTWDFIGGNAAATNLTVKNRSFILTMRGDIMGEKMQGIGIFEGYVTREENDEMTMEMKKIENGPPRGGSEVMNNFIIHYYQNSVKIAKLDASVTSIEFKNNALLVTIAFNNSGKKDFMISSPSTWLGQWNPSANYSCVDIDGFQKSYDTSHNKGEHLKISNLGASELVNKSDYPKDWMSIPAGHVKYASFLVYPTHPVKQGDYIIDAAMTINEVTAPVELKGPAEFSFLETHITLHRDYPMFPDEIKAFNAHLAKARENGDDDDDDDDIISQ